MCKVRKSPSGFAAPAQGITRIRIGAPGRRTSTRRTRISWRRRGMSQGQTTEPVALPAARASDGMFRPGRTQRETLLTARRLGGREAEEGMGDGGGGVGIQIGNERKLRRVRE